MMQLQYTSNPYASAVDKLMSFTALPIGWNFGRGEAISAVAIRDASAILRAGHECGFPASDVFPGGEGEVMVTFYQYPSHYVQVMIESPQSFEVIYEVDADDQLSRDCVSVAEVGQLLSKIYGDIWRTQSALPLTFHATSTTSLADSWISHLNHLQMEVEFPSLRKNARSEPAEQFAIICRSSTEASPGLQEHIGDSTLDHFHLVHAS